MNAAELASNDGRNGQPAYVAVSGTVYDVSASERWKKGNHEGVHQAGQDLTESLKTAPHVRTVIERFPVVGKLEKTSPAQTGKKLPLTLIIGGVLLLLIIITLSL
ncbi:MAG TPA: cytochrome b5 domain-containing protein [Malonomonas sp.]